MRNYYAKNHRLLIVAAMAALLLAALLFTPQAARAQGTASCSGGVEVTIEGETHCVDPMLWRIIVALIRGDTPTTAVAPVAPPISPLAPSAPLTATAPAGPVTVLINVARAYQPSLDYAKDPHEVRPANSQATWPAQIIERAMVARYNVNLDAMQMLYDAVAAIQQMAQDVNAPRGSGPISFEPDPPALS